MRITACMHASHRALSASSKFEYDFSTCVSYYSINIYIFMLDYRTFVQTCTPSCHGMQSCESVLCAGVQTTIVHVTCVFIALWRRRRHRHLCLPVLSSQAHRSAQAQKHRGIKTASHHTIWYIQARNACVRSNYSFFSVRSSACASASADVLLCCCPCKRVVSVCICVFVCVLFFSS